VKHSIIHLVCLAALASLPLQGATTWNDGLGTAIWSANGNWTANEPNAFDVSTFGAAGAGTITLAGGEAATDLIFNADYTLTGGDLTLGWFFIFFGDGGEINTAAGVSTLIESNLSINATRTLIKLGTGRLTLSGTNTFATTANINAGVLNIQSNDALGTTAGSTTVATGAALETQGGITVTDEGLTLNGTGIANDGALRNISGNNAFNGNITLASNTRVNSDAGTLTINPAAGNAFTGAFNLTLGGAGNITINDPIATAAGTLTKDGAGTATLTGANTYTGLTTVSAGVLNIQNNTALGTNASGTTVTSGAALQMQGGITVTGEALTLNGTGISNDGTLLNISGNNAYNANITLGSNTRINSDAGTLTINPAAGNAFTGAFDLTFGGAGNITVNDPIATGVGTLSKDGSGTLTLTAANTYTGLTTVSAGTLAYGTNNVISTGGVTVDGATAILAMGANQSDTVGTVILNNGGSITGSGTSTLTSTGSFDMRDGTVTARLGGAGIALNKTTAGTVTLTGANTYIGLTTVSAGTLAYGASNVISTGAVTVDGATAILAMGLNQSDTVGTITLNNGGSITGSGTSTLTTTGSFDMRSGTVTARLGGAGIALIKTTTGTVTLSGANTYTGLTTVSAGTLAFGASNVIATGGVTVNGATAVLAMGANQSDSVGTVILNNGGSITGSGTSTLTSTGSFDMRDGTVTARLGGAGIALNKTTGGTVTLSGANTYTGATTISAGTLVANGVNTLGNTASIAVNGGGTLLLSGADGRVNNSANLTLNGGTLSMQGLSDSIEQMGSLTLTANSIIDFGTGNSNELFFSNLNLGAFSLAVYGWSGIPYGRTETVDHDGTNTQDRLYFSANPGLSAAQFQQISFFNDAGTYIGTAHQVLFGANFEIVPVPEPGTVVGSIGLIAFIAYRERRRLRSFSDWAKTRLKNRS